MGHLLWVGHAIPEVLRYGPLSLLSKAILYFIFKNGESYNGPYIAGGRGAVDPARKTKRGENKTSD